MDDPVSLAAADWLMRDLDGAQDRAQRDAWLAADPAHAEAYARLQHGWAMAGALAETPAIAALRAEALAVPAPRRWRPAALAAGLALALVGGTAWWQAGRQTDAPPLQVSLRTRPGQQARYVLADGSVVTLDTDSQVEVALAAHRRDLSLTRGQAYFKVAHDNSRPFVVRAGEREVVAVGTEFDVVTDTGRMTVALTQGRVRVEPAGTRIGTAPAADTAELAAGQTLVFDRASRRTTITGGDQTAATDWQAGKLHFDQTPLGEAVARFNRYGGMPLRIGDPGLAALPVSGVFEARNAGDFAKALPVLFPIDVIQAPGAIVLRRRAPDYAK